MGVSRGTASWIDGRIDDYTTSEVQHDMASVEKIRAWLHDPKFRDVLIPA